jgi:hypothetical protein
LPPHRRQITTSPRAAVGAAGDDVRAGRMRAGAALEALRKTMHDVFSGRRPE